MEQKTKNQDGIQIVKKTKPIGYDPKDVYVAVVLYIHNKEGNLEEDKKYFLIKSDKEYCLIPMKQQQDYLEEKGYKGDVKHTYQVFEDKDRYKVITNGSQLDLTKQSFEKLNKVDVKSTKLTVDDIVEYIEKSPFFDCYGVPTRFVDTTRGLTYAKQYVEVVEQMKRMIMLSRTKYINNNKEEIQSLLDNGNKENQIIDIIDKKLMEKEDLKQSLNNLRMKAYQLYNNAQNCDNILRIFYSKFWVTGEDNQNGSYDVIDAGRQKNFFDDCTKIILGNPGLVLQLLKWYGDLDLGAGEYFIKKEPGGDNIISINCRDTNRTYHFKKVIDLNQPYYERHYTKYKIIAKGEKETAVYLPSNISPYISNTTLHFYDNKTKETYTIGRNVNEEDTKEVSTKEEKDIGSSFFKQLKKNGFTNYIDFKGNVEKLCDIGLETRINTCNLFRTGGILFCTVGPYYIQKPNRMQPINNCVVYDKKYYHMSLNKNDRKQHYNRCASWY